MNPIKAYKHHIFKNIARVRIFEPTHVTQYLGCCGYTTIRTYSAKKLPTLKELKKQSSKLLGVDHGYQTTPTDRSHLLKYVPKFEDLPPRSIKDSFLEGIIPLSTDEMLQEKYISFLGRVRIGRLLEDMDIFAVHIGYKHIYAPTVPKDVSSPFILVTAHCDRIDYTQYQRRHNQDIKISGFVSWVGRSSMEVVVKLEQFWEGSWHKITRALFLMAARNATGKEAVAINRLQPLNDLEKEIIQDGEARKIRRSKFSISHVSHILPTSEEQKLVHDLYLSIRKAESERNHKFLQDFVRMEECKISNIIFSQPEDRNFYNTVFGGFVMRHATELAWVLGYQFFRRRPAVKHISDISFHRPIAVNALLHMFARVVYTKNDFAQIIVTAVASDPIQGESRKSNTFHFTLKSMEPVKQVYPRSYHEAMLYIDGMRHFNRNLEDGAAEVVDTIDEYMLKLSQS